MLQDGAEALDFIFCQGEYTHRQITDQPKVILLDLKLPKVSGLEVLRQLQPIEGKLVANELCAGHIE